MWPLAGKDTKFLSERRFFSLYLIFSPPLPPTVPNTLDKLFLGFFNIEKVQRQGEDVW